jgi:hypothetical protein
MSIDNGGAVQKETFMYRISCETAIYLPMEMERPDARIVGIMDCLEF